MDYDKFFRRKVEDVAVDLLGRLILRNTEKGSTSGKIIETGAYEGGSETSSRRGMKYAPGRIFLMPYRGFYLLNISTDKEGYPSCVEIRQVAFHDKTVKGAGAISKALDITFDLDNIILGEELQILGEPVEKSKVKRVKGTADNCLGYFLIK